MNDEELRQTESLLGMNSVWKSNPNAFLLNWAVDFERRIRKLEANNEPQ